MCQSTSAASTATSPNLSSILHAFRWPIVVLAFLSLLLNILALSGAMFMLEIYDRVLPSHSVPTLLSMILILVILMCFQGALEHVRTRALLRIGAAFDEAFAQSAYLSVMALSLRTMRFDEGAQAIRDLDQVRGFVGGAGLVALFDLPWIPVYIAFCFLLHPWMGYAAIAGAAILIVIALATEILMRRRTRIVTNLGAHRQALIETARRNSEVLRGMGFGGRFAAIWGGVNRNYIDEATRLVDRSSGIGVVSKTYRQLLQSLVLALGAYLVIRQEISPGSIIAGSIIAARALAPIELAIANTRGFANTRDSWRRLSRLLTLFPARQTAVDLPAPSKTLSIENLTVTPPGIEKVILSEVSLLVEAGSGLAVIGPSGSGKSSLVRAMTGVWQPLRGKVKLDGAALDQWQDEALGRHIGYLPQDIELFPGTIAQNIARFDPEAPSEAIIEAAQGAGVHDLVLTMANGYATMLGEGGANISAGQRQRIALARALYGKPFLLVLDEPNSNLDAEGEIALTRAVTGVRERGGIVVVVAHRSSVLAAVDLVAVIAEGRLQAIGPRDEIMSKLAGRSGTAGLKVVGEPVGGTR